MLFAIFAVVILHNIINDVIVGGVSEIKLKQNCFILVLFQM